MEPYTAPPTKLSYTSQTGSAAIEFALIFLLFFFVVFVMLNLGMAFAAQQSINYAAQESARSILTFQPGNPLDNQAKQEQKVKRAFQLAQEQTQWINTLAQNINNTTADVVNITICSSTKILKTNNKQHPNCAIHPPLNNHEVAILIDYHYGQYPLIPNLGVLNLYELAFSKLILGNNQRIRTSEVWGVK